MSLPPQVRHFLAAVVMVAALAVGGCQDGAVTGPPGAQPAPEEPATLPAAEVKSIPAPEVSSLRSSAALVATCAPATAYPLSDGKRTIGSVSVGNDATNLYVTYAVPTKHWWLSDSRLAIEKSASAIPRDKKGNPAPWSFTYSGTHEPPVTSYTYTVALSKIGVQTGADVYIAAMGGVLHPVVETNYAGSWEWMVMWGLASQTNLNPVHKYTIASCGGATPAPAPAPAPPPATSGGLIAITFDDGYLTAFSNGYPVLRDLGLKANVAVNPTPVNEFWADYMTLANLNTLWGAGWGIVSHTMDHADLTTLTPAALDAQLRDSQAWLVAKGFGPTSVFIVPFHSWGAREHTAIQKYYKYTRGHTIDEFSPARYTPLPMSATPMDLYAFEPEFAPYRTAAGRALTMDRVKYAVDNGKFLDLLFHRIPATDVPAFKQLMTEVAAYKSSVRTWRELVP